MAKTNPIFERFAYLDEAISFAQKASRKDNTTLYVVESPSEEHPTKRITVDDSGFIRNWERLITTFTKGHEEQP